MTLRMARTTAWLGGSSRSATRAARPGRAGNPVVASQVPSGLPVAGGGRGPPGEGTRTDAGELWLKTLVARAARSRVGRSRPVVAHSLSFCSLEGVDRDRSCTRHTVSRAVPMTCRYGAMLRADDSFGLESSHELAPCSFLPRRGQGLSCSFPRPSLDPLHPSAAPWGTLVETGRSLPQAEGEVPPRARQVPCW